MYRDSMTRHTFNNLAPAKDTLYITYQQQRRILKRLFHDGSKPKPNLIENNLSTDALKNFQVK